MITTTITLINWIINALALLLLINVILSYFMSPFHPVRETLDRIFAPMLNPIRNLMPQTGMVDFSPIVLYLLLRVVGFLLVVALQPFA